MGYRKNLKITITQVDDTYVIHNTKTGEVSLTGDPEYSLGENEKIINIIKSKPRLETYLIDKRIISIYGTLVESKDLTEK